MIIDVSHEPDEHGSTLNKACAPKVGADESSWSRPP